MTDATDDEAARQIAALELDPDRPLIISDADEVIADFMGGLESYMQTQGYYFNWASYRLNENIRRKSDHEAADRDEVFKLIGNFFAARIDSLDPIADAIETLGALSARATIVVLSNQPFELRDRRRQWLEDFGLDVPLVTNDGPKGPAVQALIQGIAAPVYFLDDSPSHHTSVAADADRVFRIHFVANSGLAPLIKTAPDCHERAGSWREARGFIEGDLAARGY
ncbi:MAG: hypothetical protein VCB77_02965 [Alphaproteobacteria bacterium]